MTKTPKTPAARKPRATAAEKRDAARAAALGVSLADLSAKTPAYLRALALAEYVAETAETGSTVLSPARAVARISEETGIEKGKLRSTVDPVYFRENGTRNPLPILPLPKRLPKTADRAALAEDALAVAVADRRNAGGTLGRWESLASALAAALGRPVAEPTVRALAARKIDLAGSYVGRGTRDGAKATRADAVAEILGSADGV